MTCARRSSSFLLCVSLLLAAPAAGDNAALNDAAKSWWAALPDCDDVTGKLEYDSATESFVCRTDAGGGGGGDNTFVGGAPTVDADFIDTAEVDVVLNGAPAPDTIAMNLINGSIADARLATNYSGVGACAVNTFASTLNDAAAPTCTQPSFANLSGAAADGQVDGSLEADEVVGTETDESMCTWETTGSLIECDLVPSGELGGTWAATTLDDGVTVDAWVLGASTATTPAANDNDTSLATSAFTQSEIDDGDNLTDNCTLENDATPIPDSCVGDGSDAGGAATGTLTYHVEGLTGCGNTTDYMGPGGTVTNCNATQANVAITHSGPTLTIARLKCTQRSDTTCTTVFTIFKNGAASAVPAATCTNIASCSNASATSDTIANADTWSIRVVDNASTCTNGVGVTCNFVATF